MKALKLSTIIDYMQIQPEETHTYFDTEDGEFIFLSLDDAFDADLDLDDVAQDPRYVCIPNRFEIHEYRMMERFARQTPGRHGDELYYAIKGSGAFRYFRDTLFRAGLRDEWREYRQQSFAEIARDWCNANNISFDDDIPPPSPTENEATEDEEDSIDWDKVDETALALMFLTTRDNRSWKSYDWGITNRLHEKGYIGNPKSKAKSFVVTPEGQALSEQLFYKLFSKES